MSTSISQWTLPNSSSANAGSASEDNNVPSQQRARGDSCCSTDSQALPCDESKDYPPEKIEKRRLSLDFLFGRRSSKGKLTIKHEKRGSTSSTASKTDSKTDPTSSDSTIDSTEGPSPHLLNERRKSTRMENNSDLVAWCFI